MILSVVIVSYNVKFFLEQCLSSLKKAIDGSAVLNSNTEVFVIDNASTDGTIDFLKPLFPDFRFIQNKINTGFAKANNQAVSLSKGDFVLFLNPDTIVAEDSLDICISFFKTMPDAGAVGLKMIDGAGNYLEESKRGFPTPAVSFYKMTGLTRLFPRSKFFSGYYLGHIHQDSPHSIDVLPGAFMMIRKTIIDMIGGFDEQFFMYAEDIDLSFRIKQIGYQNYYLPQSSIIHFKGESTRRDIKYVKVFYNAMELFIKKHFTDNYSPIHLYILKLGIRFRQVLARFQLRFEKSAKKPASPIRIFVKGAENEKQSWKIRLDKKKIFVVKNQMEANEILFCEGPDLSWKSIITEITNNKNSHVYKFHGTGTHSAVGSDSSRRQGDIFEI
ncbi:MAG TPA: glycosyltransferase family 2 protein [Puia sp.]|nr:glycosyltransferase family 2 protein [Puia sp.]